MVDVVDIKKEIKEGNLIVFVKNGDIYIKDAQNGDTVKIGELKYKFEEIEKELDNIKDFEVIRGGLYVRQYEVVKILEEHKKQAEDFGNYIKNIEKELNNE